MVGGEELVDEVMKGEIDFDAAVATPDMMAVGRQGRPGPRSPRPDAEPEDGHRDRTTSRRRSRTSRAARSSTGRTGTGNVHAIIGKKSFAEERACSRTISAVVDEILRVKPSSAKGRYIRVARALVHHGSEHPHRSDEAKGSPGGDPDGGASQGPARPPTTWHSSACRRQKEGGERVIPIGVPAEASAIGGVHAHRRRSFATARSPMSAGDALSVLTGGATPVRREDRTVAGR